MLHLRKGALMREQPVYLEPASRPGPITAGILAIVVIGGLVIYYWPQIKDALSF